MSCITMHNTNEILPQKSNYFDNPQKLAPTNKNNSLVLLIKMIVVISYQSCSGTCTINSGWSNGDGKKSGFDMREFLMEIRHLRTQLERCIETNNNLRKKLEEHLLAKNQRQKISTTNTFYAKDMSHVTSKGKFLLSLF